MLVSPVGWWFGTLEEVVREAKRSAEVTHNHPEGIIVFHEAGGQFFKATLDGDGQNDPADIPKLLAERG